MALEAYFERQEQNGSKSVADARGCVGKHILPVLGNTIVTDLSRDLLVKWQAGVAVAKPRIGPAKRDRTASDAIRAGRATANRTLAILRAALNQAFHDGRVASDVQWRSVRPFRDAGASRLRYFTKDECQRLDQFFPGRLP